MRAGAGAAAEARPLEQCLKAEIERSKPASNDEALTVIAISCQDIETVLRPKVIEAFTPPATPADLERTANALMRMLRPKTYLEFTGLLPLRGRQGPQKAN
jgi:hypothetical protein